MKDQPTGGTTYNKITAARRISWPAVFAGLVIGLAIQVTFSFLGLGLGASSVDPLEGDTPGKGIAIGAGIYLLITGLVSTYIGARIASYLSGSVRPADGALHGLLSWGAATLVMAVLVTSAVGGLIGGAMGVVGQAAGGATQGAAQVAANQASTSGRVNIDVDAMKREAQQANGGTGAQTAQQQGQGMSEQKAREAGDKAASATAGAALWSFMLLALGAVVAAYGGASGRRERLETTGFEAQTA